MYYLPLLWLPYQSGDENLILDGSTSGTDQIFHFNQTKLYPVTPNPVRGLAKVGFTLAEAEKVSVEVFDLHGRLVETMLANRLMMAGEHIVDWNTALLPSGLYYITLRANGQLQTQKVLVH
jgi:hypothetical protein